MKTKELKISKGITLIALVITIIVLLILVGVTIATLTGENGIITRASDAREETEIATVKERARTDILGVQAENEGKISKESFVEILNNYFMDVPTVDELPEDLSTLILATKDEYGEHKINISEIYNGDFSDIIVVAEKTIEDLKAGEKVYYDTGDTSVGTKGIIECIVLYDTEYNETKGTNYGIQIISADTVGDDVTLGYADPSVTEGSTDLEKAINSYNNAITTLNAKAEDYLNEKDKTETPEIAIDARCVGSIPNNKNSESGNFKSEYDYLKAYLFKDGDTNYEVDYEQMHKFNIDKIDKSYWMASRYVNSSFYSSQFNILVCPSGDVLDDSDLCYLLSSGTIHAYNYSYGFRPVFTLKSGIKITEGDGVNVPYTLVP